MLTMQDLIDAGHPFPRQRALDYANGYLEGMEYGASEYDRASLRLHTQGPSVAFRAGAVRARLDCTAARCAR